MTIATTKSTITEHEAAQVQRANASGATPIVFVHGLWLLPSNWDRWGGWVLGFRRLWKRRRRDALIILEHVHILLSEPLEETPGRGAPQFARCSLTPLPHITLKTLKIPRSERLPPVAQS